jgi:hypothetical protein
MSRKMRALLLSAFVLPGLGQIYLGRKAVGAIIIVLINILMLLGIFVLLKGITPLLASYLSAGAVRISPTDILKAVESMSGFGKAVLAAFFLVWAFSMIEILKYGDS